MYLRSTPRRNKDGSEVRYLQLAHNVWDRAAKRSKVQVLYNFGREDAASREALQRLAASVARHLEPGDARAAAAEGLEFAESRPLGGTWGLDALWGRLGIGPATRPTPPSPATSTATPQPAGTRRTARPRGSGPSASPRTTATTCPRSSSAWPSPGTASRSVYGAGPGTPPTPR